MTTAWRLTTVADPLNPRARIVLPVLHGTTVIYGTGAYSKRALRDWLRDAAQLDDADIESLIASVPDDAWQPD